MNMTKFYKIIEYLFYLFIFLLPWQTRWIWHYGQLSGETSQYLSFSLYATEILLLLVFLLALVYRCRNKDDESVFLNYKVLSFYILIGLFFTVLVLTLFLGQDRLVSFYQLSKFLEGFALLILVINFKFSYKKIGWAIVLAGAVQSVLAIIQFFTQQIWASKWLGMAGQLSSTAGVSVVETESMRWLRAYGSLPHPNILGGFLAICLIILIVLIILAQVKKEKVMLWLFLPLILSGLFFTFGKSAFLALAAGLLFMAIFIYISKDKEAKLVFSQLVLAMIFIFGVLAVIYQDPLLARVNGEVRLEQKSVSERILYFQQAKSLLLENGFEGVGLGNYTLALYNEEATKQPVWYYQPVHNVYLLAAVETGIVGFVLFILIIIEALRRLWHFRIDEQIKLIGVFQLFQFAGIFHWYKRRFYWFLGLSAIFIMLLIIMAFDHYLWTLYFGIILWWLMFGLWLKQVSLVK